MSTPLQVLFLMAGGSRAFDEAQAGYPKNLVEVAGLPLVEHVLTSAEGLLTTDATALCMVQRVENERYYTADVVRLLIPHAVVLEVPEETAGAACTALLAIEHLDLEAPLLILNGDQIITRDLAAITRHFATQGWDGGIVTFPAVHPRWSYVRTDADGLVVEAAEKRPISNKATAGAYWFRSAQLFTEGAMSMISKGSSVDGRFYICPSYNELVLRGARIGTVEIERSEYISLASPHGVAEYELLLEQRQKGAQ